MIVYDDGIRPGKPAPDIYLQASHLLGLQTADCVVVEDSISGIQAARAAGIGYIIALMSGEGCDRPSRLNGIDLVVENLAQIPWEDLFLQGGSAASNNQNV